MDLDRLYHLMIALSLIGLGMVILSLVGEHPGWWNDIGEILLSFSTLLSVLTALVALVMGAIRGQVRPAGDAILENNSKLGTIDGKLDKLDDLDRIQVELDTQTGVMDRQVRILEQIRDGVTGG